MTQQTSKTVPPQTPSAVNPQAAWANTLALLKRELSEQSYKTWISPLRLLSVEGNTCNIQVPDRFYGDWLRDRYHEIIRSALAESLGRKVEIHYTPAPQAHKQSREPAPATQHSSEPSGLHSNYTFESFVIGPGNRFAHAAALAVSDAPAKSYNPLFIYGSVGLGKTHLMQAVAHRVMSKNPQSKVVYMSGEKFTNQLINAIQTRSTPAFRSRYRNTDFLLVDDIHFIAGKEATQEEFFHTFNTLYDAHKQIIVCSDRPPREIPSLEDRLISRFGWGLVADVQPPDFETRVAILKKKMERETVQVPEDVVYFIAEKIKTNIRELEGALIRVVAYASLTGRILSKELVEREILRESFREECVNVTIDKIQKRVCDYFQIALSDLRVKGRSKSIAYPRQMAMYLVRNMTEHSLPEIGSYFGGRGHATVIHACNKIERDLQANTKTQRVVEELKRYIKEV